MAAISWINRRTADRQAAHKVSHTRHAVLAALTLTALLAGCATPPPTARVVVREVPAPVVETRPPPPAVGYAWVPGHWAWREGDWRWVRGHYIAHAVPPMPPVVIEEITASPSPAHVWVRGHWVWRDSGWLWTRGTWVLR